MSIAGCILQKKEMTKIWVGDAFVPVTLLSFVEQEIVRYKSEEKDGSNGVVLGCEKKDTKKEKGIRYRYGLQKEFAAEVDFIEGNELGTILPFDIFEGKDMLSLTAVSKGKGFQGGVKRYNFKGGPKTHGSKFHRASGSTGNRKPRRTNKGYHMPGRMGGDTITLHNRPIIDKVVLNDVSHIVIRGSVPGMYNTLLLASFT